MIEKHLLTKEVEKDVIKETPDKFQAIIVLSKAWRDYPPTTRNWKPKLSIDSKISVLAAGEMFTGGLVKKIIFSGGRTAGPDNPSEAEGMREYLKRKFPEIPDESVILESESVDTFNQAEKTIHILQKYNLSNVALLTVGYQLPRAEKIFETVGIEVKKGFSSEEELRHRSLHYQEFVRKWLSSTRHMKKDIEEAILRSLLLIDTKGRVLRTITKKLRYGEKMT